MLLFPINISCPKIYLYSYFSKYTFIFINKYSIAAIIKTSKAAGMFYFNRHGSFQAHTMRQMFVSRSSQNRINILSCNGKSHRGWQGKETTLHSASTEAAKQARSKESARLVPTTALNRQTRGRRTGRHDCTGNLGQPAPGVAELPPLSRPSRSDVTLCAKVRPLSRAEADLIPCWLLQRFALDTRGICSSLTAQCMRQSTAQPLGKKNREKEDFPAILRLQQHRQALQAQGHLPGLAEPGRAARQP